MRKIKKVFKFLTISFAFIIALGVFSGAIFYFYQTNSVSLDESKLNSTETTLEVFDKSGKSLKPSSENYVEITDLKPHTKNAFISAEDKRFYTHGGLDFIRIGGAIISNVKSKSFSQGASTISQQLVKNTHLSSEKTISRKLKEFKLTKTLEKKYSKNEILEFYLNNIYFGNGCYGIENASNHYFSKSAKDLSLSESAILAGTINAPSIYDIESKPDKANERKNLILSLMHKHGKITKNEYDESTKEIVSLNLSKLSNNNYIYNQIISEACKILKITENELKNSNLKIYSHIDLNLQNNISKIINNSYKNIDCKPSIATIVLDNETNGILAISGIKSVLNGNHQPGSTIKPILVYTPAFEKNIVSPATKIIDEKINISGYSPDNADKKYHGAVSVRDSLKNSYNIPAVKILNEVGIEYAQNFAKKMGINFTENDKNLATALGGFSDGTSLISLVNAYSTFANNGSFSTEKYINKIIKNNNIIYRNNNQKSKVMSDSTAYQITDILLDTSKSGTAKRLKNFDFDISSKTGTVGKPKTTKNSDAYNISYTTKHTILSYFGGTLMPESINGATYPTLLTKDILEILYKDNKPQNFIMPTSVKRQNISKSKYDNNILLIADENEAKISEIFNVNTKIEKNNKLDFNISVFNFENKKPIISFYINDRYSYNIFRKNNECEEIISSDKDNNIEKNLDDNSLNKLLQTEENNNILNLINTKKTANKLIYYEDKNANSDEIYEYFVEFYDKNTKKSYKSNIIKLKIF